MVGVVVLDLVEQLHIDDVIGGAADDGHTRDALLQSEPDPHAYDEPHGVILDSWTEPYSK